MYRPDAHDNVNINVQNHCKMATTADSDSSIVKNMRQITVDSDVSDGILDVDDDHPSVLTSEDAGLQRDYNCYSNVQPTSVLPTPTGSKSDTRRI